MLNSCILPAKLEEYRKALKDRKLDVPKLLKMTTQERTAVFKEFTGTDANAKTLNTLFEQKLVLKNKLQGLKNFINKTAELKQYSPEGKAALLKGREEHKANQTERILSPKGEETFLNDLADKIAGTHISKEVAGKAFELSQKAEKLKDVDQKMSGYSDAYIKAKQEFKDYLKSQEPVTPQNTILRDVAIIRRNDMLINASTPLKSTLGQMENSIIDHITRRTASISFNRGNKELVKQAKDEAWQQWKNTGVDTSLENDLEHTHAFFKGEDFELAPDANVGGKIGVGVAKVVNKIAAGTQKIAIDWEHKTSFAYFHQQNFFDTANILSHDFAKAEKATNTNERAAEIFKDAAKMKPETPAGKVARRWAQRQAARVTSTNDTIGSQVGIGIKNILNNVVPHLGDYAIPIAKIPGNIAINSIENSPVGFITGTMDMIKGWEKIQSEDMETKYEGVAQYRKGLQTFHRSLGSTVLSGLLVASVDRENMKYEKGSYYLKFGNQWVNMEFLGPLAATVGGFIQAKMDYEDNGAEPLKLAEDFVEGTLKGGAGTVVAPAKAVTDLVEGIVDGSFGKAAWRQVSSLGNILPAALSNVLNDRPIKRFLFGAQGVESDDDIQQDEYRKETDTRFSILKPETWGSQ